MSKNQQVERDIAALTILNKLIEINTISMNATKDARYSNIGTLLFSVKQSIEDGMRETYIDDPIQEVDSSKYTNIPKKKQPKTDDEEN